MHDSSSNTEFLPLTHTWVINHVGLGGMNESSVCQWQQNLEKLAAIPTIKVKASGWEMADREYNFAQVTQTLSILLKVFGDKRVMLASNFPLTLFSCSYQAYWENIVTALQELTEPHTQNSTTQRALLLQNALDTYFL
jgi:predicted TIM-barrel fold metal-dependent hydrolase